MATKRVSEKKVVMSTSAGAAPARRKSVTQRATRSASAVEVSGTPEVVSESAVEIKSAEIKSAEITSDAVSQLAYSYWVARGCQGGSPEEDWLRAEQELRAANASK